MLLNLNQKQKIIFGRFNENNDIFVFDTPGC